MRRSLHTSVLRLVVGLMLALPWACAEGTGDMAGDDDAPVCGDDLCSGGETKEDCPADCVANPDPDPPTCGDGECNGSENATSCPGDCNGSGGPTCGDGECNGGETINTCQADCSGGAPVCGDGTCNGTETPQSCADDCGSVGTCGDGNCSGGETSDSCPADCGGGGACGDFVCDFMAGECDTCADVDCILNLQCALGWCGDGVCGLFENCPEDC